MAAPLIQLTQINHAFGPDALLEKVNFQIQPGERVCLIGRNGAGKSTLLKCIDKTLTPQEGNVWHQPSLRLARLEQVLPTDSTQTVYEFVAEGLAETGKLLTKFHHLTHQLSTNPGSAELQQLQNLQQELETRQAWQYDQQIQTILSKLSLPPPRLLSSLSGGWQRRAALAKALVIGPDLLLLDEPTNHLDIEAIQWLENYLLTASLTLIFITHDRSLLQRLATRIIELELGNLMSWPGDYQNFLRHKEELREAGEKQALLFDKKLAQEEQWIRQGIQARRTRNEGRVRALKAMRLERFNRRSLEGNAALHMTTAEQSGRIVIEAQHVSYEISGQHLIDDFSIHVLRGDRIGLIGANGVGKSTLLNVLLGNLPPQKGTVTLGTKLEIAYFDQKRSELELAKTAAENVIQGSDFVEVNGKKQHIISYLEDFLFTPQRAKTPVRLLSGGERNRLLLAKLFTRPTNLLVMDEPTNDLDLETLELLEELLMEYKGTLLLVSHDRQFLENIVTSTLVFEGEGLIRESIGGFEDWLKQRTQIPVQAEIFKEPKRHEHKQKSDFNRLTQKIENLETELERLHQRMAEDGFYTQPQSLIDETLEKVGELESKIATAYAEWERLM